MADTLGGGGTSKAVVSRVTQWQPFSQVKARLSELAPALAYCFEALDVDMQGWADAGLHMRSQDMACDCCAHLSLNQGNAQLAAVLPCWPRTRHGIGASDDAPLVSLVKQSAGGQRCTTEPDKLSTGMIKLKHVCR